MQGPLPASGVSVMQLTPESLDESCQRRYLISPTEMFKAQGVYTVRVTLFSPVLTAEQ
jgi:hypothetical protein